MTPEQPTPAAAPEPTPTPAPDPAPAAAEDPVAPVAPPTVTAMTGEAPKGWNWGAFFLTWIWGIGNSVWIALLALISPVGLVMMFVLGAKGNEWAWKAKQWESVEQFKATQRKWAIWGLVIFLVSVVLITLGLVAGIGLVVLQQTQVRAAAEEFMVDLKADKPADAYKLTSPAYQSAVTQADFSGNVDQIAPELSGPIRYDNFQINSDNGHTTASMEALSGNVHLHLSLVKNSAGHWLVQDINTVNATN